MNQVLSEQTFASHGEGIYMTEQVTIPNPLGWVNGGLPLIHTCVSTFGANGTAPAQYDL